MQCFLKKTMETGSVSNFIQNKGGPYSVGSLRKRQPQSLDPSNPAFEDRNRSNFQNTVFLRKEWMMDKVKKHDSSKCNTPSSEPFRTDS
jgi:hypothetical protein